TVTHAIVIPSQQSPEVRLDTQNLEVVSCNQPNTYQLHAIVVGKTGSFHSLPGQTGKHRVAVTEGNICGIRKRVLVVPGIGAEASSLGPELNEFARLMDRQEPQQKLIHQCENRGIGADPESQRENCSQGKSWFALQLAEAVPQVLPHRIDCLYG